MIDKMKPQTHRDCHQSRAARQRVSRMMRYHKLKESGLCVRCGKANQRDRALTCQPCADAKHELDRRLARTRVERGLCYRCGRDLEGLPAGSRCGACMSDDWFYRCFWTGTMNRDTHKPGPDPRHP